MMGGMGGYGYDYPGVCDHSDCHGWGTHVHENHRYCAKHYRIVVQGFTPCPGCRMTGIYHDHGISTKRKCPLCKGEGVCAP